MELVNIFEICGVKNDSEIFDELVDAEKVKVERIISTGHKTPEGEWLIQEKNEFVLLLAGKAGLEFRTGEAFDMRPGDHLIITSGTEHRVKYTQEEPPTIWLAVHY